MSQFVLLSYLDESFRNKQKLIWYHAELRQEEDLKIGKSRSTTVEAKKKSEKLLVRRRW